MEKLLSGLSQALPGKIYLPSDEKYTESLQSYFSAQESQIKPYCIIRPETTKEVATIVTSLTHVNRNGGMGSIKFAIRSGGHASFAESANAPSGITIDLRGINSIDVDEGSDLVAIDTGASWGDVYRRLEPLGLSLPGGRHSQVGVGGLTLGGGLTHFSGHVGLVCDNVVEYEVVLASGEILRVTESDKEHGDLFHALRGGSNNFGVLLETKDAQLQTLCDFCAYPSFDPNASLIQSFGFSAERGSGCVNSVVYTKPESEPAVVKPFLAIEPIYMNTLRELSITELTREQDAFNKNGLCQIMICTTYHLDLAQMHRTFDLWQTSCDAVRDTAGAVWSMTLHPIVPLVISRSPFLQSAIPSLPKDPGETRPILIAQLTGTWRNHSDTPALEAAARSLIADVDVAADSAGLRTGYLYLNYAHEGQDPFGQGHRREQLCAVSKNYDPDGIFQRCVTGGFKLMSH